MLTAFRQRHPWCAGIIGLIFGPSVVMLYLAKGRLALIYLVIVLLVLIGVYWGDIQNLIDITADDAASYSLLVLTAVGALHAYKVAKGVPKKAPQVWFARWYWIVLLLFVLPGVGATMFKSFALERFHITANSMAPTLLKGAYVWADKYAYGYSLASLGFTPKVGGGRYLYKPPKRGDLVVFLLPPPRSTPYLKRVIGAPGDTVQMKEGLLFINGEKISRIPMGDYIVPQSQHINAKVLKQYEEILPGGERVSILEENDSGIGDNTQVFRVPHRHFFVLGDNRDNSLDSRFEKIGFVPVEALIGRVTEKKREAKSVPTN